MNVEDRLHIMELIAQHGHFVDDGELDRLHEVFTEDVVYDASDYGMAPIEGLAALRAAALALGDRNPVAHHVTNIVVTEQDGRVSARAKGIGVMASGTCGSVTYQDTVVRGRDGWRISHRRLIARRAPLGR
ncbi:nuclear transport factor 2 family protein [Amycolatopsis sp. CA-230715]|uniref:nuclear transport factor 2 family protein n=1 Tax=Amycolatopsis sp. CA-230715 TaxID=2745196 RepID=UPI001C01E5F5|nr:nuclear transport factor 2 family protein [Amycolatopsis sp. CA-230715]QWF79273.1 hypothetical protein HUW46_02680 [Amycolatopsis sp. CA-230715]